MPAKLAVSSRLTTWFWPAHFRPEPGTEQGQALVRLRGASYVLALLLTMHFSGVQIGRSWWTMSVYAVFGYLWVWVTGCGLMNRAWRIRCTLVLDNVILATGFYLGGEAFALVMWAIMFAAIGYGLRFGSRYAMYSVALGMVCTGTALALSPFWRTQPLLSFGVLASLVILPGYAVRLSEQISRAKRELEQKAADLETASRTDPLTGALNRRGLLAFLAPHLESLQPTPSQSALLFIDLDDFKLVNDVAGHAEGDAVLQSVALQVADCLRPSDHVSRLGGDEFVALITDLASECDAHQVALRMLKRLEDIQVAGYPQLRVGASIGICFLPHAEASNADAALQLADRLMYQAKRSGKNRIFSLNQSPGSNALSHAMEG